jgi:hypothetical protein
MIAAARRLTAGLAPALPLAPVLAFSLTAGIWCLFGAAPTLAAAPSAHWSIVSQSEPTYFKAGDGSDAYRLIVRNDGALPTPRSSSSSVTVADTLPPGVTATRVSERGEGANGSGEPRYDMTCAIEAPTNVTCTYKEDLSHGPVLPGAMLVITITVSIPAGVTTLAPNSATVSGGGAPGASIEETTPIDPAPVPFGLAYLSTDVVDESGGSDTQAGSHPFELTASLGYAIGARESPSEANGHAESPLSSFAARDLEALLPPGLIGDPSAVPQCSQQDFQLRETLDCPLATQVGTIKPLFYGRFPSAVYPVFNISPPPGQPAELGFSIAGIAHIPIFIGVRGDRGYRVSVQLREVPEAGPLQGAILTLWGVPADGNHDLEREGTTGLGSQQHEEFCKPSVRVRSGVEEAKGCPSGVAPRPFLTLPGNCEAGSPLEVLTDSWQSPEPLAPFAPLEQLPPHQRPQQLAGCERLSFAPTIALAPESSTAGSPSGYTMDLHVPQSADPTGLATPDLRQATLRLPPGVALSPSAANGLEACSEAAFAPESAGLGSCPAPSQIGTVSIQTPLLASPLAGEVFLGQPSCAPCSPADAQQGRLIRVLVAAEGSGVTVKLRGAVAVDQATGQLQASFTEAPQLPFEDLRVTFTGGARAPLANPLACGVPLSATMQLTSYGGQAAEPASAPFELGGCPAPQFNPTFVAGTTDNRAGSASPAGSLSMTFSRSDADQLFQGVAVHLPPGLTAMLSKVAPCPELRAQTQTCTAQSDIGSATVGVGPGSEPFFVRGRVYLTGPYGGAPFGLSIVVAARAGPLDLGTVNVRARIEVDPHSGAVTVTSDPWPQSIDGVPLQIKAVNVTVDRKGLIVEPTSCNPMSLAATITSAAGTTAAVSSRFQAAGCGSLRFLPRLLALTHAAVSKRSGVYLHVKVVARPGHANIAELRAALPRQLALRLATLQQACTAPVFDRNPSSCPVASVVGTAAAVTPLLNTALVGHAYLVAHGAAAPELAILLQGQGVTLRMDGRASVRGGAAAVTFRSLPDVPLSTFDLVLSPGPRSLLVANLPTGARGDMCGRRLTMPVSVTAQNGAVVAQNATVAVSGCVKR